MVVVVVVVVVMVSLVKNFGRGVGLCEYLCWIY